MILANHLSRKLINEKEMKFSYFFFFIQQGVFDKLLNFHHQIR